MRIPIDKQKHAIVGLLISLIAGFIINPIVGLSITTLIGGGKELIWDLYLKKGNCELNDFLFTLFGGIIGFLINII